jgi:tRNA wybutosine-synthesizing protein 4
MFHSLTAVGEGEFLIVGGRGSPLTPSSKLFHLRLKHFDRTDHKGCGVGNVCLEWIDLDIHGFLPCWRHTASYVSTDSGDHKIIIFGGRTNDCVLGDTIEIDMCTRTVTKPENRGDVPCVRHSHSATVQNDRIVIISGGLNEDEKVLSDIFCLRVSAKDGKKLALWTQLESIPAIKPRYSHTSHVYGDCLLLIGGVQMGGNGTGDLTIINLNSRVSRTFRHPVCDPEKWVLLHKHTSDLLWDGETAVLVIIGGGGNCFSFGTHINCGLLLVEVGREVSFCQ